MDWTFATTSPSILLALKTIAGFATEAKRQKRVQSILQSSLGPCVLGHWLRYEEHVNHVECFRRGGQSAGRRVFMIHVWSRGSHVDYYAGSHLHNLNTTRGLRSVWEVAMSELDRVRCVPDRRTFPDGGLYVAFINIKSRAKLTQSRIMLDARLAFEIKSRYAITFMFATEDVVAKWAKIILPPSAALAAKVADMERKSKYVRLNFRFQDDKDGEEPKSTS